MFLVIGLGKHTVSWQFVSPLWDRTTTVTWHAKIGSTEQVVVEEIECEVPPSIFPFSAIIIFTPHRVLSRLTSAVCPLAKDHPG